MAKKQAASTSFVTDEETGELRHAVLSDTVLEYWQERDRLNIGLKFKDELGGQQIFDAWGEDAQALFEDGFIPSGKGEAAIHKALFEHCQELGLI